MAEQETGSDFYRQFSPRMESLLKNPTANGGAIKAALWELVEHIGKGIWITPRSRDIHRDAFNEVWIHVVNMIPDVDPSQNATGWFGRAISRQFWKISKRENDSRVSGAGIEVGDDSQNHTLRMSDYSDSLRDVRAKQRRFSSDNLLSTLGTKTVESFRRHYDDRIGKAVEACGEVETQDERIRADAYLQAIQEERWFVLRQYKKCETAMVRYTADRRIEKEQEHE